MYDYSNNTNQYNCTTGNCATDSAGYCNLDEEIQTPTIQGSWDTASQNLNTRSMAGAPIQYGNPFCNNFQGSNMGIMQEPSTTGPAATGNETVRNPRQECNNGLGEDSNTCDSTELNFNDSKMNQVLSKINSSIDQCKMTYQQLMDFLMNLVSSRGENDACVDSPTHTFPETTGSDNSVDCSGDNITADDSNFSTGDNAGSDIPNDFDGSSNTNSQGSSMDYSEGSVGNGQLWQDADGDGDADMTLVVGAGIDLEAAQQAAQNIEEGSNGKLDVQLVDQAPTDGREYGRISVGYVGNGFTGWSGFGSGSTITIDPSAASSARLMTHEMMHCAGVTLDANVNGGDSIMDYSYQGTELTDFDKGMLQKMYGGMQAGKNN